MRFVDRFRSLLASCFLGCAFVSAAPAAEKKPNVLFVISDDQRWDTIAALGNAHIKTPTLNALVQRGFVFRNAYCMGSMIGAVCMPSRTMLMSGRSLWRIPEPRAKTYDGGSLGSVFRDAGYATLFVGKRGNSFIAGNEAFETFIYHDDPTPEKRVGSSQFMADKTIDWLRAQKAERPFCIYLGPPVPHDPRVAPEEFMSLYDPAKIPLPASFMPQHPFDNGELRVRDELLAPFPRTPDVMRRHLADYYACITNFDRQLGRVVAELKERGQLENTVIVFTSDHGLAVGGMHGLMGKQNLYEHNKPPLIFAGPGIPRGQSDALVYLFDLFPTLCDYAGLPIPSAVEGKSLMPVVKGMQPKVRDTLLGAYRDCQRMIRDDRWKLIKYNASGVKNAQLFDLASDPDELRNLATEPAHAAEFTRLEKLLADARREFGDPSDFDRSARAAEPVTIVAFGDSTTAPRGSTTIYSAFLREELRNVRVINAGVGGNTTEMARQRFEKDVLSQQPQVAVIQFGINDAAVDVWRTPPATEPRISLEKYETNLRYFVRTLKSKDARVVLMTPNPLRWTPKLKEMYGRPPYQPEEPEGFNVLLTRYCEAARRVAGEEGAELIDVQRAFPEQAQKQGVAVDGLLLDGMHPNDAGHRVVADLLRDRILAMAKEHQLRITEGPRWKPSGDTVMINPLCTDITLDSPNPVMLGCGLARMKDGAVTAVYSTPSSYYSKPGATWIAGRVTKDGGKTWSPERQIARHPDCQPSHPSVLTSRDGVIHVFYLGFKTWKWEGVNPTAETQSDVWTTRSADNGATWSEPQMIFKGYSGATNGAIETRDGRLLVPYSHYVNDPGRLNSRVSISADGGRTWSLGNPIDIGGAGDHEGALEPSLLELKDGRVWMLIRTTRGQFWQSFSSDGGATWSAAQATNIDATSAPGHLTRLADGRIALVWNPKAKNRRELHFALSADEGNTWTPSVVVAKGKSTTYPFVIEVGPGELWIGYHDVPNGWNFPRARHVKIEKTALVELTKEK